MELKHKLRVSPIYEVDHRDLEEFVEKHLGFRYDFVQANEVGNDSTTEVWLPGEPEGYDRQEAEELIEKGANNEWSPAHIVMNALRIRGLVEPGTYLINVCW